MKLSERLEQLDNESKRTAAPRKRAAAPPAPRTSSEGGSSKRAAKATEPPMNRDKTRVRQMEDMIVEPALPN